MPFITGYLSNKLGRVCLAFKRFQCPLSRATFQTIDAVDNGQNDLIVSMPFITGYLSNVCGYLGENFFNKVSMPFITGYLSNEPTLTDWRSSPVSMPFITGYLSNPITGKIKNSEIAKVSMPFITGYLSNNDLNKERIEKSLFQCPLSRATFQTLSLCSVEIKDLFQCPLSRATFQTF